MARIPRLPGLMLALTVALTTATSCVVGPTAPTKVSRSAAGGPGGGQPATVPPAAGPSGAPASPKPGTAAPVLANQGARLTGVVRAPADLVSRTRLVPTGAADLVSRTRLGPDAATDLVSRTRYVDAPVDRRSLAGAADAPVAGVPVAVVGADGMPLRGPDGRPIETTTDADGRYRLPFAGNSSNAVLRVGAADAEGAMWALVPPDPTGAERRVDVDLASTLVIGYVLDRFVKAQADPQASLDRLPADVAGRTRDQAERALEAGGAAPSTLAPLALTTAVDALRARDAALDQGLEEVRRLLVAAGLSNLGDGRPATEVPLNRVWDLVAMPDGTTYLACPVSQRIWRIGADGRLETAVGRAPTTPDADIDGRPGPEVAIDPARIARDRDGLLVLEPGRLSRLGADGRMKVLWKGSGARAVAVTTEGRYRLVLQAGSAITAADLALGFGGNVTAGARLAPAQASVIEVGDGLAPTTLATLGEADAKAIARARRVVDDGKGGFKVVAQLADPRRRGGPTRGKGSGPAAYELAAPAFALRASAVAAEGLVTFDGQGQVVAVRGGQLTLGDTSLPLPPDVGAEDVSAIARGAEAPPIVAVHDVVYRLTPAGPQVIGGVVEPRREGPAHEIALRDPGLLAVTPDGTIYVWDFRPSWLWRIGPDGRAAVVLEGERNLMSLRTLADGRVLLAEGDGGLTLLDEAAKEARPFPAATPRPIEGTPPWLIDVYPRPDGGVAVLQQAFDAQGDFVFELIDRNREGKTLRERRLEVGEAYPLRLALVGDVPYVTTEKGALCRVEENALVPTGIGVPGEDRLVVDRQGRLLTAFESTIVRIDPRTGATAIVAGGDAGAAGAGVDASTGRGLLAPDVDARGALYFLDPRSAQVKRLPAGDPP